jgi:hypothetical protein
MRLMKVCISFISMLLISTLAVNTASAQDTPPYPPPQNPRQVIINVYLQGFYIPAEGQMRRAQWLDGAVLKDRFTSPIAESIVIQLRDKNNYNNLIIEGSVNLLENGQAGFYLSADYNDSYYITVKTRNHLVTVSAAPVSFAGTGPVEYNFTNAATKAYGNNQAQIATGVFGIYAGDVNQDGFINLSDRQTINDQYLTTILGYVPADLNGDGFINLSDRQIVNDAYLQTITVKLPD